MAADTGRTLGKVASVTIFNSGGREGREGGRGARWSAAAKGDISSGRKWKRGSEIAYGISDGVSGLEVGGGRLMKVGRGACAMAARIDVGIWDEAKRGR